MEKEVKKEEAKVTGQGISLRSLLTTAKAQSTTRNGKGFGHVGYAKRLLRRLKKEIGKGEFDELGPGVAYAVVCAAMKREKPELYKKVENEVGLKRYRNECSVQYYGVKDEK